MNLDSALSYSSLGISPLGLSGPYLDSIAQALGLGGSTDPVPAATSPDGKAIADAMNAKTQKELAAGSGKAVKPVAASPVPPENGADVSGAFDPTDITNNPNITLITQTKPNEDARSRVIAAVNAQASGIKAPDYSAADALRGKQDALLQQMKNEKPVQQKIHPLLQALQGFASAPMGNSPAEAIAAAGAGFAQGAAKARQMQFQQRQMAQQRRDKLTLLEAQILGSRALKEEDRAAKLADIENLRLKSETEAAAKILSLTETGATAAVTSLGAIIKRTLPDGSVQLFSYTDPDLANIKKAEAAGKLFNGKMDFTSPAGTKYNFKGGPDVIRQAHKIMISSDSSYLVGDLADGYLNSMPDAQMAISSASGPQRAIIRNKLTTGLITGFLSGHPSAMETLNRLQDTSLSEEDRKIAVTDFRRNFERYLVSKQRREQAAAEVFNHAR